MALQDTEMEVEMERWVRSAYSFLPPILRRRGASYSPSSPQDTTDPKWPEVLFINAYARNIRLIYLGVKGLGILVMTWTTVVLLGGFVSVLQKKDFWSLTAITLIQLAGTFEVDKLGGEILGPFNVAVKNIFRIFHSSSTQPGLCMVGLHLAYSVLNALLVLLVVLLAQGIYICTGISLWRLIIHDYYGKPDGGVHDHDKPDGGANLMKPALDVLYTLALVQGVLFIFMNFYCELIGKIYVKRVRKWYDLKPTNQLVSEYLQATIDGCTKVRGFDDGRNLVTYAVDMLVESKSPESYLKVIRDISEMLEAMLETNREWIVKQLTDWVCFSHIVCKLLQIMHPRSIYSRETKQHAAGIVRFVAGEVRLEQLPGGIQSITSLLVPSEEYRRRPLTYHWDCFNGFAEADQGDWLLEIQQQYEIEKKAEPLMQQEFSEFLSVYTKMFRVGLCILWELADDEGNCRVISNTEGLMSRITAPLISSQLHHGYHKEWTAIARESLPLLCKFMVAPGDGGAKLRRQVSSNDQAIIRALETILMCVKSRDEDGLHAIAMEILLDLSVDASSIVACIAPITTALLRIFLLGYTRQESELFQKLISSIHWMKKRSYIRNLASGELVKLCSQCKAISHMILQAGGESTPALLELTDILVGDKNNAKNNTCRMRAAEIMEHLCRNCTNDDNYLRSLKEAVLKAMPKVLTEILGCGSTGESTQAETEENQPRYSGTDDDLEEGPTLPDNEQNSIHCSRHCSQHQQNSEQEHGDSKLEEALLSLCETVCQKWISTDPDLARRFDEIASTICSEQGKPLVAFTLLVWKKQLGRSVLTKKND